MAFKRVNRRNACRIGKKQLADRAKENRNNKMNAIAPNMEIDFNDLININYEPDENDILSGLFLYENTEELKEQLNKIGIERSISLITTNAKTFLTSNIFNSPDELKNIIGEDNFIKIFADVFGSKDEENK